MKSFGDKLFAIVDYQKHLLFVQGELAELTYQAFMQYIQIITNGEQETIDVTFPVGYRPDKTAIHNTNTYPKADLISRYEHLGLTQLPINAIYQLITTIETLLGNVIRAVLNEFPAKIPNKRKVDAEMILESSSLEVVKHKIIDSILNELNYKSPRDFAVEFNNFIGINLLEKPVYHRYIELKATRDIYIHNAGVANEVYLAKSDTLARVRNGEVLPVTIQYFLESYEYCLQLTEVLEQGLHKVWPSSDYIEHRQNNTVDQQQQEAVEKAIEDIQEQPSAEVLPSEKPQRKRPTKKLNPPS